MTPDPLALAAWTAEVDRAKAAYYAAPSAWADQLAGRCDRCYWGQHYRCTVRWSRKRGGCTCRANKHPNLKWWT